MSDTPERPRDLARTVGAKAARKLRARRNARHGVWFGLGMMGLVGWSVVLPTLLGASLGAWLDRRHPGGPSWTLSLLVVILAAVYIAAATRARSAGDDSPRPAEAHPWTA